MGISNVKSKDSIGVAWIKKLRLISKSQIRILILGLDNVGKTTMMYTLELGPVKTTIPVFGCHRETFEWKNIKILSWDLGGADIGIKLV
jgi:GTPase SAR1 family protein